MVVFLTRHTYHTACEPCADTSRVAHGWPSFIWKGRTAGPAFLPLFPSAICGKGRAGPSTRANVFSQIRHARTDCSALTLSILALARPSVARDGQPARELFSTNMTRTHGLLSPCVTNTRRHHIAFKLCTDTSGIAHARPSFPRKAKRQILQSRPLCLAACPGQNDSLLIFPTRLTEDFTHFPGVLNTGPPKLV